MADIICQLCDARGETPGTCECVAHVGVTPARRPAVGSQCLACGDWTGCLCTCRLPVTAEAEAMVDRLIALSVQAATSKRVLHPAPSLRTCTHCGGPPREQCTMRSIGAPCAIDGRPRPARSRRGLHAGDYEVPSVRVPRLHDAAALIAASAWRETLASNLATAGALCAADRMGYDRCSQLDARWRPGCGRPMPGWGGAA